MKEKRSGQHCNAGQKKPNKAIITRNASRVNPFSLGSLFPQIFREIERLVLK